VEHALAVEGDQHALSNRSSRPALFLAATLVERNVETREGGRERSERWRDIFLAFPREVSEEIRITAQVGACLGGP